MLMDSAHYRHLMCRKTHVLDIFVRIVLVYNGGLKCFLFLISS